MAALSYARVTDPDLLEFLPQDQDKADAIVTEMLRASIAAKSDQSDVLLENRPDWQEALRLGRQERMDGNVISHEDVLRWNDEHR